MSSPFNEPFTVAVSLPVVRVKRDVCLNGVPQLIGLNLDVWMGRVGRSQAATAEIPNTDGRLRTISSRRKRHKQKTSPDPAMIHAEWQDHQSSSSDEPPRFFFS